jgi:hypothetical protein
VELRDFLVPDQFSCVKIVIWGIQHQATEARAVIQARTSLPIGTSISNKRTHHLVYVR